MVIGVEILPVLLLWECPNITQGLLNYVCLSNLVTIHNW